MEDGKALFSLILCIASVKMDGNAVSFNARKSVVTAPPHRQRLRYGFTVPAPALMFTAHFVRPCQSNIGVTNGGDNGLYALR